MDSLIKILLELALGFLMLETEVDNRFQEAYL